jgi:hypothetical protein
MNSTISTASAVAIILAFSHPVAGDDIHWAMPVNGSWLDANNWLQASVPSQSDRAVLGLLGEYTVEFPSIGRVGSIAVENPDASLHIASGARMEVVQSLENHGAVRLDPNGVGVSSTLEFINDDTIFGSGRLTLGSSGATLLFSDYFGITHEFPHTIDGVGRIEGDFVNRGTIEANAGGVLELYQTDVEQEAAGQVRVIGDGSVLQITRGLIDGGRVLTEDGGQVRINDWGGLRGIEVHDQLLIETLGSGSIESGTFVDAEITALSPTGAQLYVTADTQLLGEGQVILDPGIETGGFQFEAGFVLPVTYKMTGHGRVSCLDFTNESTVRADRPGKTLRINGITRNKGILAAVAGATLRLDSQVSNEGGRIYAEGPDSRILFERNTSVLDFGTLETRDGALVVNATYLYIDSTLLLCEMYNGPQTLLNLYGSIYHNQTIELDNATLEFENRSIIYGPGVLRMRGPLAEIIGSAASYTDFTNGIGHRIEGSGAIDTDTSSFMNAGIVSANIPDEVLSLRRNIRNFGRIEATNGGVISIASTLIQSANAVLASVGSSSTVEIGGVCIGGELRSEDGGRFVLQDGVEILGMLLNADIEVTDFAFLDIDGESEINGIIDFTPSGAEGGIARVNEPNILRGEGTIRLSTFDITSRVMGGTSTDPLRISESFRIEGDGYLWGYMEIDGAVAPGVGIGTIECTQRSTLSQLSVLEIQIAPQQADLFRCSSTLTAEGSIEVEFIDGFSPVEPWSRVVIQADELEVGQLTIELPEPPAGLVSRYYFDDTTVRVGQTHQADMTLDGQLDFFDVGVFLDAYSKGDFRADLNTDLTIDFFDVTAFIQAYLE